MSKIRESISSLEMDQQQQIGKIHLLKGVKSLNLSAAYDQKPKKIVLHRISRLEKDQHLLGIRAGKGSVVRERTYN